MSVGRRYKSKVQALIHRVLEESLSDVMILDQRFDIDMGRDISMPEQSIDTQILGEDVLMSDENFDWIAVGGAAIVQEQSIDTQILGEDVLMSDENFDWIAIEGAELAQEQSVDTKALREDVFMFDENFGWIAVERAVLAQEETVSDLAGETDVLVWGQPESVEILAGQPMRCAESAIPMAQIVGGYQMLEGRERLTTQWGKSLKKKRVSLILSPQTLDFAAKSDILLDYSMTGTIIFYNFQLIKVPSSQTQRSSPRETASAWSKLSLHYRKGP